MAAKSSAGTTTPTTEPAGRNWRASKQGALGFVCVAVALSGCGPEPAPAVPNTPAPAPKPLHRGPLSDYVAAAGLRWLVLAEPSRLMAHPKLGPEIRQLVPEARLDAYAKASGIDLREVRQALVAGFDLETLYMASVDGFPSQALQRFSNRLKHDPLVESPGPELSRITGVVGEVPQTLLAFEGQFIAVSVGSATPIRVAEAYATGRLKRSPPALKGAALSGFPESHAPLQLYAPGPFEDEWARGFQGLLAATDAVMLEIAPGEAGLLISAMLRGSFTAIEAEQALTRTWKQLQESPLGKLTSVHTPLAAPRLKHQPGQTQLEVELALRPLISGLKAAVISDVWELMDIDPRPEPAEAERALP